jgi:hypothetical protein
MCVTELSECESNRRGGFICNTLNVMTLRVNVPVLSLNRYDIRPNSSGIVLLRTTVPGIALSRVIKKEYNVLPISKLTRKLLLQYKSFS